MCHESLTHLDVGDADLGELLPMARLAAIVLPALELEDVDLLFLAVPTTSAVTLAPLTSGVPALIVVAVGGEQHLVERDLGAGLGVHEGKADGLALLRAELLAQRLENRVHDVTRPKPVRDWVSLKRSPKV